MKNILFLIGSGENDHLGFRLFLQYPYGKNAATEWQFICIDNLLENKSTNYMEKFDSVYHINLNSKIASHDCEDIVKVKNIDTDTLTACSYLHSSYILWEGKTNTTPKKQAIELVYQKTHDAQYDFIRMKEDFLNIIYKRISKNTPKKLYQTDKTVSNEERIKYQLLFKEQRELDSIDKKLLSLPQTESYISTQVEASTEISDCYCRLHKKIRDVIHFDAWVHLTNK